MADKYKRGLPSDFVFEPITPVSDLGDYLDETRSPSVPSVTKTPPAPPVTKTRPEPGPAVSVAVSRPAVPAVAVLAPVAAANADLRPSVARATAQGEARPVERNRPPRHSGPRREINMSPETLRMSDELLELIRGGSGQRDTKANELMHALVLLAFEAKDTLDPFTIPKRGRWGTPTARAYPIELKNAFLHALLKKHA